MISQTLTYFFGLQERKMPKRKPKTETVDAEIECIIDERGNANDQDEKTSSKRKRRKKDHQYLCAWTDGEDPQWVDAVHLQGTPALEEWEYAKEEEDEPEMYDTPEVLKQKCKQLAELIKNAKRPAILLGAGISAPILPTFRGKNGLWTKDAHKNEKVDAKVSDGLQPTLAHRGLVALERAGHVYWIATQNYDDLSVRSGYPESKLSELHGNIFTETCDKCNRKYHRDYEVPLDDSQNHETGRNCEDCGGILRDSIIHFGESLPWHDLKMANAKFMGADLTIAMGSSLKVEPAASLPFKAKRRNKNRNNINTCIINLQSSQYDDEADLVIRGTCDQVINTVCNEILGDSWDR